MATQTPWGKSDSSKKYAPGIVLYSTPGHGGFHLSPTKNVQVHPAWRKPKGWYEEDLEFFIVALTFPHLFDSSIIARGRATLKNYYPDQYGTVFETQVQPEDSCVLRERADRVQHANDMIVLSAYGDWHAAVPTGMVGVFAGKGGRTPEHRFPAVTECYLVPADQYDNPAHRCSLGFIVPKDAQVSPVRF